MFEYIPVALARAQLKKGVPLIPVTIEKSQKDLFFEHIVEPVVAWEEAPTLTIWSYL